MNASPGIDWTSALLFLAAGLVLGTVLVWKVFGRARALPAEAKGLGAATDQGGALELRDLEGKRDTLLAQLRELEDTASKRTEEQLARERYALELQAAQALLALDARGGAQRATAAVPRPGTAPATTAATAGPTSKSSELRGFIWGTLSASALGLLMFFLYTQARPREAGGSVTGDLPGRGPMERGKANASGAAAGAPARDAEEQQIRAALDRDPNDLDAHLALARVLLGRQDMMGVWNETKLVLERSPGQPQALAYQALVRLAMGQGDKAVEMLKQALTRDPDLIDGYVHLALVYVKLGKVKEAEATITEASRRFPDQAASLQKLLADLQRSATVADAAPQGDENPHTGIGAPGGGGAATAAPDRPAAGSGRRISGTVDLDPSLKGTVLPGAVLFVFVREAGFGAGPPVAAKRLPATAFPIAFEIGESDAMMGQPFPDALLVEARLDADGDPTTRPPTDPKARLDDVKTGSTGIKLLLQRP